MKVKAKRSPTNIKELRPDPENARKHTERNIRTIVDSLHEVGAARSIVIDEEGVVLAGNGAVEAATAAGLTKIKVVDTDRDTLVAVRRTDLTPEEKRRLALYDNRAAELAEWAPDQLRQLADEGTPLDGLWTPDELSAMFTAQTAERIEPMKVNRPTDVAWVLLAIPITVWPKHQAAVEAMQDAAVFSTMVLRPKDVADGR